MTVTRVPYSPAALSFLRAIATLLESLSMAIILNLLALARALMPSPEILILDEPTAALAPNIAEEMLQLIVSLKKSIGISILLVEQRAKRSMELSDRGYILVTGRIAAEGSAKDLLSEDKIRKLYLGVRDTT